MAFSIKYKPLLDINILHLFFLNQGTDIFTSLSEAKQLKRLKDYNVSDFMLVKPSTETAEIIKGFKLVFKNTPKGITIWTKVDSSNNSKPFLALYEDLNLTFTITLTDKLFYNYTNIKPKNERKIFYFSNRKLADNSNKLIPLSGEDTFINSAYFLSDLEKENELERLNTNESTKLLGLIRIFIKADKSRLSLLKANGNIQNPHKAFELSFENRKTIWRYYFNKAQNTVDSDDVKEENSEPKILITKQEQPLTQKGFVPIALGDKELPNPNYNLIKPKAVSGTNQTIIFSEIYM